MGDGGRRRRSRLRRSRQRRHGGASVMGVSAAEEAGPDETPDAKEGRGATSDTQGREERRGCERACRDGAAHVLYYRMGHLGRKLSDHLREAAGRVHLGRLARQREPSSSCSPIVHSPGAARRLAAATSSSFALFESPDKRNESDPSRLSFLPPSVWRRACPDGSSLRRAADFAEHLAQCGVGRDVHNLRHAVAAIDAQLRHRVSERAPMRSVVRHHENWPEKQIPHSNFPGSVALKCVSERSE